MSSIVLEPFQREGVEFLRSRNGILAWEPGVGKTYPALAAGREVGGDTLYLCPPTLKWQVEASARALFPDAEIHVLCSGKDRVPKPAGNVHHVVVVAPYSIVLGDLWKHLFKREWGALVLDEAHYLRTPESLRTRAVYGAEMRSPGALFRRARHVWALSGSIVLNNPIDIWIHYSRLFPFAITNDDGDPLTRGEWIDRFCLTKNNGFGVEIVGGKNLDELNELLAPWVDWKDTVTTRGLDLPTIDTITLDPANTLKGFILPDDVAREVRRCLSEFEQGDDDALTELGVSRSTERRLIGIAKAPAVANLVLTELEGGEDKIIVFGQHVEALEMVSKALAAARIEHARHFGPQPSTVLRAARTQFLDNPSCRVILGNIVSLGTGHDLQVARRVIFAEADWLPGINDQALRRAWRTGQARHVHASFVSLHGSIDQDIQAALTRRAREIAKIKGVVHG